MGKELLYEIITKEKIKRSFLTSHDFNTQQINGIITNLVKRIKQYLQDTPYFEETRRELKIQYSEKILTNGDKKIIKAEIKSNDEVIKGLIQHVLPTNGSPLCGLGAQNGKIKAEFYFNSNNLKDRREYVGLAKIIQSM